MGWVMTDNSDARGDEEPRPSPTEPDIEESALDPAGHHTPAQEQALAEQTQTDEENIERAGDETTAREVESGQLPDAAGDGTPGAAAGGEAATSADAEAGRGQIEEDSLAVTPDAEDADDNLNT